MSKKIHKHYDSRYSLYLFHCRPFRVVVVNMIWILIHTKIKQAQVNVFQQGKKKTKKKMVTIEKSFFTMFNFDALDSVKPLNNEEQITQDTQQKL